MRRLLFFLFYSLFSLNALLGQQIVEGRVVDRENQEPLVGAHIYLLSNWRLGVVTDVAGSFRLEVPTFKDSLVISFTGFEEKILAAQPNMQIQMTAIPLAGEMVTVLAKPLIAEEFQYTTIQKMDIYTNPAAQADPILAVNSLPSATTTDESANISLRGSSPIETGIFLNNVPIYDAVRYAQLNGIGTFSIFNTAIIKQVSVFAGNPPLEFGNVTSGAIAIETDDRVLEANATSAIVSLASLSLSREQRINDQQSIKIFTNWQPSNLIKRINGKALSAIQSFNSNDLGIYWYGATNRLKWKVLSYSNIEGYKFNFEHPSFQGIFDQKKLRSFIASSAFFPLEKGELSLNNGVSASKGDYAYSNVAFQVDNRDLFLGLNYQLDRPKYAIKSGLSYDFRGSDVEGNFHSLAYALDRNHPTIQVAEQSVLQSMETYVYTKFYPTDEIAIGAGVRKNIPTDSINYLSRQVNMSFSKGKWNAVLGWGKYHKRGLFENSGTLFFSESVQKSLDINYAAAGFKATLSFFDKQSAVNGASYEVRGVEFFQSLELTDKLVASGSLTWLDAVSADQDNFQYDLNYFVRGNLSYSPGKNWTIESALNARQGVLFDPVSSASFDQTLNVYQPIFEGESFRLPNYWNLGLSVSKVFLLGEELSMITFLSFNNVFDRNNVRTITYSPDYSRREDVLFSQRTGYLGFVFNF